VRRWRRSGLKAGEFAARIGVKPGTLTYWGWRLKREAVEAKRSGQAADSLPAAQERPLPWIELRTAAIEERFELELGGGRRLRIPASFDAAALERLLAVLEGTR
jgi:hypothetical protein